MNAARNHTLPSPQTTATANYGLGLMLSSVLLFSVSILAIKAISLRYGTSLWMLTLPRFAIGLAVAAILFRGRHSIIWSQLATSPWMILRGVVGGAGVLLYNWCVIELGPGRTSVITSTYPIFGALLAPLFLPEVLRWRLIGLCSTAILGIALIVGSNPLGYGLNGPDGLAVVVAALSGLVVVSIRKLHATSNTATIFAAQCGYGLIFCIPGAWMTFPGMATMELLWIMLAAVFVALGQLCLTESFKSLSVAKGSSLQLLGPPIVAINSFALFGERLSLTEIAGAAVVLFACYRIARQRD